MAAGQLGQQIAAILAGRLPRGLADKADSKEVQHHLKIIGRINGCKNCTGTSIL